MSTEEQDRELGRLLREHGERRQKYIALTAKLNRIGGPLQATAGLLTQAKADVYSILPEGAIQNLAPLAGEIDLSALVNLLREYSALGQKLVEERDMLRKYGVDL